MLPLRAVLSLLLALATAVVALAQLNLPTKEFWQASAAVTVQWLSVGAMAVFIVVNEFRIISHLARAARIREFDLNLRAVLSAVLFAVVDRTGVRWDELAVCYYRTRGRWRRRHLIEVASVALGAGGSTVQSSARTKEGVVGTAFSSQEIVAVDWFDFVDVALEEGREAWNSRGEQDRFGLAWGQLRRPAGGPFLIATATFNRDGSPDGCVLLSGPPNLAQLSSAPGRRILEDLATALDRIGPPPPGWWRAHGL